MRRGRNFTRLVTVGIGLMLVAGCGGGGADGPPTPSKRPTGGGAEKGAQAKQEIGPKGSDFGNLKGRFVFKAEAPDREALSITKDQEYCGKFDLKGESLIVGENGGIKNVVIYIRERRGVELPIHESYESDAAEEVPLDNKECRFDPHVQTVWVGKQTLKVLNSDPIGHNTNIQPSRNPAFNVLLEASVGTSEYTFDTDENYPVPVSCNIHPWMRGYVVARESPYYAVSAEDGTFEIQNLPTGTWEFQVWHEKPGALETEEWERGRFVQEIAKGDNDLGDISVPSSAVLK